MSSAEVAELLEKDAGDGSSASSDELIGVVRFDRRLDVHEALEVADHVGHEAP
jgi:hypothetical protein